MAALAAGARLGTYEIVGPLGAGGMGEVYRARDLRLGREVAVKVLPEDVASSADRLARFEREARTVAGLNHPNIVTLHSVEDEGGIRFITMELVEGQSLAALVTPGGMPLARALELGVAIADALAAAHEHGVVHRDVKPENVMVTREGRIKVLDFGLAKARMDARPAGTQAPTVVEPRSEPGMVAGTVPYMAPEQILGEAVDARSDLFSFGIVLYELLAGRRPFRAATAAALSAAILRDAPEPLAQVRAGLPADLERLVARCLEKDPRDRALSALDVAAELRRLRRDLERAEAGPGSEPMASIAVLPFANRSASADDEYFSDGLADELLNVLARIRGLRVAARTSSFRFKGKDTTIAEVGGALKVATVLEGSVRRAGDRVRISVQLVQVSDGYQLWSETYDRTLEDIFAVQSEIAQSVVKELRATLLGGAADPDAGGAAKAEVARAARGRGNDAEAHRLYLLARHLLEQSTRDGTAKGIEYLKLALEQDPAFALAWVGLGLAYAREADRTWVPMVEGHLRAREAVERALALEPDLAEGHAAMGWLRMSFDWDWRGAEASLARALELAPGDAMALRWAGVLAWTLGRAEEAIRLSRQAVERDPLSAAAYHNLGHSLRGADRPAEAEEALRGALELAPHRTGTRAQLSLTLLDTGRVEEAMAEARREPDPLWRFQALALLHHAGGRVAESEAALREMVEGHWDKAAFQIAEVHGARGEADRAFEWLERAYAQRDPGLDDLLLNPHLRALRGDPRWAALAKKMGLMV